MNNNSFISQLSSISKSKEEAQKDKSHEEKMEVIQDAKRDYNQLKNGLLNYAKNNGYTMIDGNKEIIYLHSIPYPYNLYIRDDGSYLKSTIFGGVKLAKTNILTIKPNPKIEWDSYFSEIRRLGSLDKITISPVVYDTTYKRIAGSYPLTKRSNSVAELVLIDIKLKCKVRF